MPKPAGFGAGELPAVDARLAQSDGSAARRAPPAEDYAPLLRAALEAHRRADDQAALLAYERVLGRADDPRDQIRALLCIAALRLLPSSKVHDEEAAAVVVRELERRLRDHGLEQEFFGELEIVQRLAAQDAEMEKLRKDNAALRRQLKQKEEVIRQLRALSVGG